MLVDFFQTSIVGNKLVQSVRDIVGKLTNHVVHLVEFLNGDILPDFNRKVVGIMDSVFLIIAVQPDTLRNIFLVDREREPIPDKFALVVLAKISDIHPHVVNHRHTPLFYGSS